MARLRLLQPYENRTPGDIIELPGGVASVLVLRKIAEIVPAPQPAQSVSLPVPQRITVNVFPAEDGKDRYEIVRQHLAIPDGVQVLSTEVRTLSVEAGTEVDVFALADYDPTAMAEAATEFVKFDIDAYAEAEGLVVLSKDEHAALKAPDLAALAVEDGKVLLAQQEYDELKAKAEAASTPAPADNPKPSSATPKRGH